MRQHQTFDLETSVAVYEQIEIDEARPPALAITPSSETPLRLEQALQQLHRRLERQHADYRVDERLLLHRPKRRGAVERAARYDPCG